jgi:enamine deaminase RidA (YjgF/YER057c/UK114 family)
MRLGLPGGAVHGRASSSESADHPCATRYTHVVEASAPGRTIYVAGQVGMAPDRTIAPDFRSQVTQCFENLKAALAAAGAGFEHVVKTTNYFVDIGQLSVFREVRDRYVDTKAPPASTAVQVGQARRAGISVRDRSHRGRTGEVAAAAYPRQRGDVGRIPAGAGTLETSRLRRLAN